MALESFTTFNLQDHYQPPSFSILLYCGAVPNCTATDTNTYAAVQLIFYSAYTQLTVFP